MTLYEFLESDKMPSSFSYLVYDLITNCFIDSSTIDMNNYEYVMHEQNELGIYCIAVKEKT